MELKKTEHSYYCCDSNYYVNGKSNFGRSDYDSWDDFRDEWLGFGEDKLGCDMDYNLCFRYDIIQKYDNEKPTENFELKLYFILQRKGIYRPVWIKTIKSEDMAEIEIFLKKQWAEVEK